jgi:hypothetical protein
MKKVLILSVLVILYLMSAPGWSQTSGPLDFKTALKMAQADLPGGILLLGRSEVKGLNSAWGFYIFFDGRIFEIEYAGSRPVKKIKHEVIEPQKDVNISPGILNAVRRYTGAKLPYNRYLEIALRTAPSAGGPIRIEVQERNGRLAMVVGLGNNGTVERSVVLDMGTGRVIG